MNITSAHAAFAVADWMPHECSRCFLPADHQHDAGRCDGEDRRLHRNGHSQAGTGTA